MTIAGELVLYHGTTRRFHAFDQARVRSGLNDRFWTPGGPATRCSFFTTSFAAAQDYGNAARNNGLPAQETIDAVATRLVGFPWAAQLFQNLVNRGREIGWNIYLAGSVTGALRDHLEYEEFTQAGYDLHDIADLSAMVEKSKSAFSGDDTDEILALLNGGNPYQMLAWQVELALSFGIDCRPAVAVVVIPNASLIEAGSRDEAEKMLESGALVVRIPGDEQTVRRADEVLVANMSLIRVTDIVFDWLDHDEVSEAVPSGANLSHAVHTVSAWNLLATTACTREDNLLDAQDAELALPIGASLLATFNKTGRLVRLAAIDTTAGGRCRSRLLPCPPMKLQIADYVLASSPKI